MKNPLAAVVDLQKRFEVAARRMSAGSLGGRTDSASPFRPPSAPATGKWDMGSGAGLPVFSQAAVSTAGAKGRFYHRAATSYRAMEASLDVAGVGTTTVILKKNGTPIAGASLSWATGATGFQSTPIAVSFESGDYMQAEVTAGGAGATGLVVQPS